MHATKTFMWKFMKLTPFYVYKQISFVSPISKTYFKIQQVVIWITKIKANVQLSK